MVMFLEKPRFDLTSKAVGGETATSGEILDATLESMRLVDNAGARVDAMERAYDDRIDVVRGTTGQELPNPERIDMRHRLAKYGSFGPLQEEDPDPRAEFQAQLEQLATEHPEHRAVIAPERPILQDAKAKAKAAETRFEDVWAHSDGGVAAWSARLAGGLYGSMYDPVNVATLAVGPAGKAGAGVKGLLWMGLKNGAANAGTEALIQPFVQQWRKEAGLSYGFGQAAINVAGAGLFGFGLDAGVRGAWRGGERIFGGGEASPAPRPSGDATPGARLPNLPEATPPSTPPAPVYRGADPLPPLEALEQAARNAPEGSVLRRASEGDEAALRELAKQLGPDADPAIRRALDELEIEKLFPTPLHVDDGAHLESLARAIREESGAPELPVGDAIIAPVRREVARLADEVEGIAARLEDKPVAFRSIDPASVTTDASTFQFKSGGDAAGVTDRLRGVTRWDPVSAGKAIVFERADGEMVIADGHQRLGLAQRVAAEGQDAKLDAYVFREADGWTPEDVRAYAALKNMRESSGTSVDMAQVMRDRPDLIDGSLPLTDAKLRDAAMLARLSPEAFDAVVAGRLPPPFAALIGESVADSARHRGLLDEMAAADLANTQQARLYLKQLMELPTTTETQMTLFGEESFTRTVLIERAQVLDSALKTLKQDKRIFGLLRDKARAIESAGNVLARDANQAKAENAAQLADLIEKLATSRGPVATILNDAAASVARGLDPKLASRAFVDRIADTLERDGIPGLVRTEEAPKAELAPVRMDDPIGPEAKAQMEDINWALELDDEIKFAMAGLRAKRYTAPEVETPDQIADALKTIRASVEDAQTAPLTGRFAPDDLRARFIAYKKADTDLRAAMIGGLDEADALARYADVRAQAETIVNDLRKTDARINRDIEKDIKARGGGEEMFSLRGGKGDQTQTPEFKRWFGDSKVVDAEGKPLVVYKGMPMSHWEGGTPIEVIDSLNGPWAGFFTDNKFAANEFAEAFLTLTNNGGQPAGNVLAYVRIERPYVIDAQGRPAREFMFDHPFRKDKNHPGAIAALDNDAYDGIIIKNSSDEGTIYVPKKPTQIKSKFSRAFDPNDPRIAFALRGFYSPAIRAAQSISMKKGTGEQFLKQITKVPGVRKDELEWMGLEEFLKGKPSVTRDEVLSFMRAHQVELDEKVLGGTGDAKVTTVAPVDPAETPQARGGTSDVAGAWVIEARGERFYAVSSSRQPDRISLVSADGTDFGHVPSLAAAEHIVAGLNASADATAPKFGQYKVPGGENYRELLIRLPVLGMNAERAAKVDAIEADIAKLRDGDGSEETYAKIRELRSRAGAIENEAYSSKHFHDQEIVHLRVDDRTGPGGEKVLFINEVQSDLHQAGRQKGYQGEGESLAQMEERRSQLDREQNALVQQFFGRGAELRNDPRWQALDSQQAELSAIIRDKLDAPPQAPFKGDLWLELALKRALLYASENGYDAISWARSDQIAKAVGAPFVNEIKWRTTDDGIRLSDNVRDDNGKDVVRNLKWGKSEAKAQQPTQTIAQMYGEDIAAQVRSAIERGDSAGEIGGLNLPNVGMHLQYDHKIGRFLRDYTKKWGAKVERTEIEDFDDTSFDARLQQFKAMASNTEGLRDKEPLLTEIDKVVNLRSEGMTPDSAFSIFSPRARKLFEQTWGKNEGSSILRITPEMRASVMEGQPLAMKGGQSPQATPPRNATLHNTTLSTRASDEMASMRAEIDKAVAKSLPPGWRAEVRQSLVFGDLSERIQKRNPGVPPSLEIEGTFDPYEKIIYVSLAALDPVERAYEEAGHALKAMRLIPQADYAILAAKASEIGARQKFRIDERYGDVYGARWKNNPARLEEALEEEAIMQMVAARARGDTFGRQANAILDKLIKFLRAIRDMLGVKGFRTFEDVFEDMTEGGFARAMEAQRGQAVRNADVLGGEVMAGGPGKTADAALRVYHSSPSDFTAFSGAHAGTGQGQRMHGPGVYLGSTEDVAKFFGRSIAKQRGELSSAAKGYLDRANGDRDKALEAIADRKKAIKEGYARETLERAEADIKRAPSGYFYEATIKASPENLVQGETRLADQPLGKTLLDLIGDYDPENVNFAAVDRTQDYNPLVDEQYVPILPARAEDLTGTQAVAILRSRGMDNAALTGKGIVGMSYAEGDEAIKGKTSYVIFDPAVIEIASRQDAMFAIREPQSPTAADASFIARAEAASEIMFALGDEGKGKTPEKGGEAKSAPERPTEGKAPAKTAAPSLPGGRESKRIRNLINQAAAEGKLPREDADALIQRFDMLEAFHKDGGKAKQQIARELDAEAEHRKRQKALAEGRRRAIVAMLTGFRDARGQADPAKAMQALIENLGQHELPQGFTDVAGHQRAIYGMALADLDAMLHEFRKTLITGTTRNKAQLANVVRELHGEATGDEMAAAFAQATAKVMEDLRLRFNAAGGNIAKRKDWNMPQSHDKVALLRGGRDAKKNWVEFTLPLLDLKWMKHPLTGDDMPPAEVRKMLGDVWDNLVSDGWHEREATMGKYGVSAIANTRADPRSLIFANADAWMKYSARYGSGDDALATIVSHIRGMTKDIAAMEVLGPNPTAMLEYLRQFVVQQASLRRAGMPAHFPTVREITGLEFKPGSRFRDPLAYANVMTKRAENMWRIYTGAASAPESPGWAEVSRTIRNVNVGTKLGGAAISGLGDLSWQVLARKFAGLPVTRMIGDIIDQIKPGGEREARRAGVIAETYLHMHNEGAREGAAWSATKVSGYVADRVLTLSMLNGLTRAGNHAMAMGIQGHLADMAGRSFADLDPRLQRMFRRWGLESTDWDAIRLDAGGRPRQVDFLSPADIRRRLIESGGDPFIAERYLGMTLGEAQYATLTGSITAQARIYGNLQAGTAQRELWSMFMQFKSFAVNIAILQLGRVAREFVSQGLSRGAQYAAGVGIITLLGGAIVEQLQQLRNGKDPRDMRTGEFWGTAAVRSGGLSIWGDLLYASQNRMDGGIASTVGGPSISTLNDILNLTYGSAMKALPFTDGKEKTNFGRELSKLVSRNTPGASLWYVRTAWERVLMDNLQRMLDPEAEASFRRKIQNARRDYRQEFWWKPGGGPVPQRGPRLDAMFGAR